MRYLLLIVAIWVAFYIIRHFARQKSLQGSSKTETRTQEMVRCEYCGVHVPRQEAIRDGDQFYCSNEHMNKEKN